MALVGGPVVERLDRGSAYVEGKARKVTNGVCWLTCPDREGVPGGFQSGADVDAVRRKSVVLHDRRADSRAILTVCLQLRCADL
jgi:hypothetical protein